MCAAAEEPVPLSPRGTPLRKALGSFVTGVTVLTALNRAGQMHGMTVSAFTPLSLDPPQVLVCVSYGTRSYPAIKESGSFAVHILRSDQAETARAFARQGADKNKLCQWRLNERGFAVLDRYHALMECRLHCEHGGGDHAIFIGEVETLHLSSREMEPLAYYRGELFGLPPAQALCMAPVHVPS